jgi:hypothetical protein
MGDPSTKEPPLLTDGAVDRYASFACDDQDYYGQPRILWENALDEYLLNPGSEPSSRSCGEHGLPLQDHSDGLEGVDAMADGGADDGSDGGVEVGAPVGAETAGHLAIGRGGTQLAFGAIVVGADLWVVEEGEQVAAELSVSFSQSSAVRIGGRERHDGIEIAFQPLAV